MKYLKLAIKEKSYKIFIKKNIYKEIVSNHFSKYKNSRAIIISDKNVVKLYLDELLSLFIKKKIEVQTIVISPGEKSKDLSVIHNTAEKLLKLKVKRNDIIYALGGGVVGDFSGFLASIILRGIKFIQVPTTLLAQVDSSVGGKTGVNSLYGKNLIGSFYQPSAVFINPNTLKTLSEREFLSGYSEVLKYSLINDKSFFYWLDRNYKKIIARDSETMANIISKCCTKKAIIVKKDEKEKSHRMLLNLGHTFAHSIEKELNYKIRHGEAVSVGLLMSAKMSILLNIAKPNTFNLIKAHHLKLNLPISLKCLDKKKNWNAKSLVKNMLLDKKRTDKNIKFILLKDIGKAFIENKVKEEIIVLTINEFINV